MKHTMQHHHAILRVKADQVEATRVLLLECALLVADRKGENGPLSWFASFDESTLAFHRENIQPLLKKFDDCMVAPPATTVREVFLSA